MGLAGGDERGILRSRAQPPDGYHPMAQQQERNALSQQFSVLNKNKYTTQDWRSEFWEAGRVRQIESGII
jgi:hypothetical protein